MLDAVKEVFVLYHRRQDDKYGDNAKILGIFSSRDKAESSIASYVDVDGFRDHKDGFSIEPYVLDRREWTEGFVTVWHD